jgi:L,D-transpeptidase ErfK/SrfK
MNAPRQSRPAQCRICAARLALAALAVSLVAAKPEAPELPELIGAPQIDVVRIGDTLLDVAERHRLGFERVTRLNPDADVWIPEPGLRVRLPTEHVLPDAPREGLVVNIPELQLYDFRVSRERPEVFALAIGDEMDPTLVGVFRVGAKRENPSWSVPKSIRAKRPELPALVPPGPDNPLGPFWMTVGSTSYGVHGTNNRWSIGREATHGCMRLYNDEIARLYARTPTGTRIQIIYQTVKIGRRGGIVYVEAHPDRYQRDRERTANALARLRELGVEDDAALDRARRIIDEARGEPVPVALLADAPVTSRRTS